MKKQTNYLTSNRIRIKKPLLNLGLVLVALILSTSQINAIEGDKDFDTKSSELQQMTVSGDVKDETGLPMPGVNIQVEGVAGGSTTNVSGKYSIVVPNADAVLVFTFIGYNQVKEIVGTRTIIDVNMELNFEALEEVVVVGYGTQKKKDLTSAIAVVNPTELKKAPVANVTSAMIGLTPGVEVQSNQGTPGMAPTVRIRGVASTNNTNPLYVIDGIPNENPNVNTNDIESMQILKDAASTAIYGSRGANGVIIITTKAGKKGAPKVSYQGYYGWEKAWKLVKNSTDISDWAQVVYENNTAGGTTAPPLALDIRAHENDGEYVIYDPSIKTDWMEEIFQTGTIMENTFDISGGSDAGNYYFSANQYKQDGIMIDTPYKRYGVRMNSNWQAGKFKFGETLSFTYSQNELEDANGGRSNIEEALKMTPNIPVYNPNVKGGYSGYSASDMGHDASNPVGSAYRASNINQNRNFALSVYGDYQILKDLTFRSTFGVNNSQALNKNFTLETYMIPKNYSTTTLSNGSTTNVSWVWENQLTYHKIMGSHDFTLMGAYTSDYFHTDNFNANGSIIQTEFHDVLGKTEGNWTVGGGESTGTRISYLGRLTYSFKGKYIINANFRRDGSSKFSAANRWGNFPSASVAWRISEEPFLNSIQQISNLKLRLSYGAVGNDRPVGYYTYVQGLNSGQDYSYNGVKLSGVTQTNFSNPNLRWEVVKDFDFGVDIGLFKGALEATVDYYDKRTEDMIIGVPIPASTGGGTNPSINKNLGQIKNSGFEFSAIYRDKIGDLDFSLIGNLATLKNEVTDMANNPLNGGTIESNTSITKTEKGHSIGEFYGYKMLGVFPDQASVTNYTWTNPTTNVTSPIQPAAREGDVQFADLNNNGKIDADDRTYIGSPIPDLTYSFTANLAYKGFDLSVMFQGVSGNEIASELLFWTEGMHNNFNVGTKTADRWTPENRNTSIPRAVRNDPNGNITKFSTRHVFDGSYLRLKTAQLGYTLPKNVTDFMKISNLRLYVSGRNLFTVTDYPFFDPEIGSGALGTAGTANTSRGIDNGYYPQARTFIMGIQVDF